jgi:hypothetical protein
MAHSFMTWQLGFLCWFWQNVRWFCITFVVIWAEEAIEMVLRSSSEDKSTIPSCSGLLGSRGSSFSSSNRHEVSVLQNLQYAESKRRFIAPIIERYEEDTRRQWQQSPVNVANSSNTYDKAHIVD